MVLTPFSKFSPGGNDTVFLHLRPGPDAAQTGAAALALLGGEQAGFADISRRALHMAGGEFCLNASRAFGALLDLELAPQDAGTRQYEVRVSGADCPVRLDVSGRSPKWEVAAHIGLAGCGTTRLDGHHTIVKLPGITHLLCFMPGPPAPATRETEEKLGALARSRLHDFAIGAAPALGFVACHETVAGESYAILPYIMVPALGTAMLEGCCGSATLALGAALARPGAPACLDVAQPKSTLAARVELAEGLLRARIAGPVSLLFRGEANLPAQGVFTDDGKFIE